MKKAILGLFIAIALCFAIPQKASAYVYAVNSTIQIGVFNGQPVYAYCAVTYNVDIWNQVTMVSYTVLGPPQ